MNDPNTSERFLTRQFHARRRHLAAVGAPLGLALGLTQLALAQDPIITLQPTNQTAVERALVVLSVRATSTNGPVTYQWQRDDAAVPVAFTNIPNAIGSRLSLRNVTLEDSGDYRVVVKNAGGESVTSDIAHLEVVALPFTRITEGAIVTDSEGSIGAGWADYDGDGYADLFVANSSFGPHVRNSLYQTIGMARSRKS